MSYRPLAAQAGRIHLCGHRGDSVAAPENTLPALEAAKAHGADVCEIDVVLTADGEIVVLHDEILDRTTNATGRVAALGSAEIARLDAGSWFGPRFAGTRVPTLREALACARDLGLALHVEIKERQRPDLLAEALCALVAELDVAGDILVISFDHPSLVRLRERMPALRTELITHARHVDPVALARQAGAASVAIEWDMFHRDDADALHRAGIATRVTIPRREKVALRSGYGLGPAPAIAEALGAGLIDILAGDDVAYLTEWL